MPRRLQQLVGVGVFFLATGCAMAAGRSADIPNPRPYPVPRAPDALIMARETEARWEKQLNVALMRPLIVANWALLGLGIAF
jgi:hypothetical protein